MVYYSLVGGMVVFINYFYFISTLVDSFLIDNNTIFPYGCPVLPSVIIYSDQPVTQIFHNVKPNTDCILQHLNGISSTIPATLYRVNFIDKV